MQDKQRRRALRSMRYIGAIGGVALVTVLLEPFRAELSTATVALALLLVVLLAATFTGRNPALAASLAGMLCFNYFFLPPVRNLTIAGQQNLIAWAAFTVTAIVAGELSAYARRRHEEVVRGKLEIERLYSELQTAFAAAAEAEAFKQSEKLKSALLDAVTHDLRTPLTSIKAAVTTLLDDENASVADFKLDAEGKREFLEIINEESDRLNHFIAGMVELARLEAGAVRFGVTWSDVSAIIKTALERAAPRLEHHRVAVQIEPELPLVRVDAKSIAEVIYTLLDNAANYSPVNTNVTVAASRANEQTIEISITDEGAGVPVQMRERVFEKFFRVGLSDETAAGSGLGLGLAIARGIVEAHNGRIWIENAPNDSGARFVFTVLIGDEN